MRQLLCFLALAFAALQPALAAYVGVWASTPTEVRSNDLVFGIGTGYTVNADAFGFTEVPQELVDASGYLSYQTTSSFSAEAYATAVPGRVGTIAHAVASGLTTGRDSASASAAATFTDVVRFDGSGVARLDADLLFLFDHWANSTAPTMGGSGSASSTGQFSSTIYWTLYGAGLPTQAFNFGVCNGTPLCDRNYGGSSRPGLYSYYREVPVVAGQILEIHSVMSAYAEALLYNSVTNAVNGGIAVWTTSAGSSLRNGITMLTPGVSFTAESGHDYVFRPHVVESVPEPGTLALLGLGLAGLAATRRRKQ